MKNQINGYFTRISNNYIRMNDRDLDKKLLLTIICLDRKRNIEDVVGFSLYDLILASGYKINRNTDGSIKQFKKQIEFLVDNGMIKFITPKRSLMGNNYTEVKILKEFDFTENYTILTATEIDQLLLSKIRIAKEKLFAIYLYIKSFIYQRNLTEDDTEFSDAKNKPMSYWGSIDVLIDTIGTCKLTFNKCVNEYIKLGLLKKHETGSYTKNIKGKLKDINAPNIYVLNIGDYQQEIDWTLIKLKNMYGIDEFGEMKKRGKRVVENKE